MLVLLGASAMSDPGACRCLRRRAPYICSPHHYLPLTGMSDCAAEVPRQAAFSFSARCARRLKSDQIRSFSGREAKKGKVNLLFGGI